MIEKALNQLPLGLGMLSGEMDAGEPLVIEIENPDSVRIGDIELDFNPEPQVSFGSNLAEHMDQSALSSVADMLSDFYNTDLNSRSEWEETYREGLDLLGLKMEERTEPWEGACGVTHPLLAEAVVRFQSETIMETFPAAGPVKTKIIGAVTKEREEAAQRVSEDMNHWLTDRMPDYRAEHERLLWSLPIAGSAFKKIYYNSYDERPATPFIPAEDFIVSYGSTDLQSAPRYAHRMKKTRNEIRKLQLQGFYRDIDIGDPSVDTMDEIKRAKDDQQGFSAVKDDRFTILEYHVDLDLPGFEDMEDGQETGLELPYVVHYLLDSDEILAVYRNWDEDDPRREKRIHFSKYDYIPGFGFYGLGLIHLVGGFAKGATAIMRQLVDAGTLSNLPGGLKTRGLRIRGGDTPIAPGEFRDTDVASGSIKENIMPLPYKEPSQVLFNLLNGIVQEGRRFAAIADVNVADLQPNAPVGSTLAILERTLKTMSAIQARVHAAMKQEFRLLKAIIRDNTPSQYSYRPDYADSYIKQADYDTVEVIPVSDPNASTMAQRIAQYQAALQLAQSAPQLYDMAALHRQMLEVLGIRNAERILPTTDDIKPTDPITENMEVITGKPVKAFMYQDHQAHLLAHTSFLKDPKVQQNLADNPAAPMLAAALMAHIAEHTAFQYRRDIENSLGVPLPHPDQKLPEDVEVELSRLSAQAADRVLQRNTNEAAQAQAQQQAQDPVVQMQMQEVQIKQAEVQRKAQKDQMDFAIAQERLKIDQIRAQLPPNPPQMPDPNKAAEVQLKAAEIQRKVQKDQLDHAVDVEKLRVEREKAVIAAQSKTKQGA
jgi:hypothetical protein